MKEGKAKSWKGEEMEMKEKEGTALRQKEVSKDRVGDVA